jgi:hypothetical protein
MSSGRRRGRGRAGGRHAGTHFRPITLVNAGDICVRLSRRQQLLGGMKMGVGSTVGGPDVARAALVRPGSGRVASSRGLALAAAVIVVGVFGVAFAISALTSGKSIGHVTPLASPAAAGHGAVAPIRAPQLATSVPTLRKPAPRPKPTVVAQPAQAPSTLPSTTYTPPASQSSSHVAAGGGGTGATNRPAGGSGGGGGGSGGSGNVVVVNSN